MTIGGEGCVGDMETMDAGLAAGGSGRGLRGVVASVATCAAFPPTDPSPSPTPSLVSTTPVDLGLPPPNGEVALKEAWRGTGDVGCALF